MTLLKDIFELIKLRILIAALLTVILGYIFNLPIDLWSSSDLFWVCSGSGFIFAAAAALNHLLEIPIDSKMERTAQRPLPASRISRGAVLTGICISSALGVFVLWIKTTPFVLISALATLFLYDFVYTPLKKITTVNTLIGAIPGAMPVLCGWFMAHSSLDFSIVSLFLILYFWQLPHFYAIAWINQESYAAGHLKMISVGDAKGSRTVQYMTLSTLAFVVSTGVPILCDFVGYFYSVGLFFVHAILLYYVFLFYQNPTKYVARKILLTSVVYPPLILLLVWIDILL